MHVMANRLGGLLEDVPAGWPTHVRATVAALRSDLGVLVEEVPPLPGDGLADPALDPSVLEDQGVPLSRVVERPHDTRGRPMPPILILYRRPLEVRAMDRTDLADLVHDVLVEQLAALLGVSPDDLDPGFHGDG